MRRTTSGWRRGPGARRAPSPRPPKDAGEALSNAVSMWGSPLAAGALGDLAAVDQPFDLKAWAQHELGARFAIGDDEVKQLLGAERYADVLVAIVTRNPSDKASHSTPAIQSTASAEAVPESQLGDDLAAALRSALENKAEADRADRARAEALFNQFQAWAAQEDAQALPGAAQSIQDVRAEIVQSPPLPKRRPTQVAHTARSQDSSPQNTQSLMRRLGFRN